MARWMPAEGRFPVPSHVRRSKFPRRSAVAAMLAVVSAALLLAACTTDEPASVTIPQRPKTTTTTVPGTDPLVPEEEAQVPPVQWALQVGGIGDDVLNAVASTGEHVLATGTTAGLQNPEPPRSELLLITAGTDGTLQSAETSHSGATDHGTAIAASPQAEFACGNTSGDLGTGSTGGIDLFCAPVTAERVLGPARQLGSTGDDVATGASIGGDFAEGYVSGSVTGLLPGAQDPMGRGLGGGDAVAVMVDNQGAAIWARQFGSPALDASLGVVATPAGDGIFAGYTEGDLEGPSSGGRDAWVSRFDREGIQRWVTQIGSAGTDEFTSVGTVGEARRGNELFIAGGHSDGDIDAEGPLVGNGGTDAIAAAFTTNGSLAWIAQFGGSGEDKIHAVVTDGSLAYLVGTTTSPEFGELMEGGGDGGAADGFIIAIDATNGTEVWTGRFGTAQDEVVTGATATDDGMLVVSGATRGQLAETPPAGGTDGFLIAVPLISAGGGARSMV